MNLLLFDRPFESLRLEGTDERARHIRDVLRVREGSPVFVGFVNGPRARCRIREMGADGSIELVVTGTEPAPPPLPVVVFAALPRPHTAKRLLFDAASLGIRGIRFFRADRGERSYAESRLWTGDGWRERLRLGAEQAFATYLPAVAHSESLAAALRDSGGAGVVLDNYEASGSFSGFLRETPPETLHLALGPERGWSPEERERFRGAGWRIAHLGPRPLRSETACVAAIALASGMLGWWDAQTATKL